MSNSKTVHFSVEGAGFTELARNIMLSEKAAQAWRLITEGLIGSDRVDRLARQLLDGDLKLTGTSDHEDGLSFVKDTDSAEYKKNLKYIYAGRVRVGGAWWRPRAEVTDFGPGDMAFAQQQSPEHMHPIGNITEGVPRMKALYRGRVAYYALEGERVLEATIGGKRQYIIFEPTSEPPFWWAEKHYPTEAVVEFLEVGRRLHQESWSSTIEAQLAQRAYSGTSRRPRPETEEEKMERYGLEEERYIFQDKLYQDQLDSIGEEVRAKAKQPWVELNVKDRGIVTVPREPFLQWALGRTSLKHLAPPWVAVSPTGMKLPMDDPFHTDWMLGARLDLRSDYGFSSAVQMAATEKMFLLQREWGEFKCAVIVGGAGGKITGRVGGEIVVLPNLAPDHLDKIKYARVIITEKGGALTHLAQVALERTIPIVRVEDATKRYLVGHKLMVDIDKGLIEDLG